MTFDVHQSLVDEKGEIDEAAAKIYENELLMRFAMSPEALPLIVSNGGVGWSRLMMSLARTHLGATVPTMKREDLSFILLETFPEKISCEPEDADAIVSELRAFWVYVGREFGLANAADCASLLDSTLAEAMEDALANPDNFGLAKAFTMAGKAAGYDMSNREQIHEWWRVYTEGRSDLLAEVDKRPTPPPPPPETPAQRYVRAMRARAAHFKKKAERKAERARRRKNRC
ncbi:hypothetical protein [Polyangium aurulentum]|uniref:hypothetical protein n=1 Tax=Polyangium aurulentum TaxID=2567896 RepID=UPI0010ADF704|nr:hypothetical protein [Polyangium aurulentum]UQA61617.1 hypothetical protein E8A73_014560 [Polyangium aurulentum]